MRILSASEAISPAFERTRLVLFSPFRLGRTWKLSATAYLSFAGNVFLPVGLWLIAGFLAAYSKVSSGILVGVTAAALLLTAIQLVIFVLCGRLQFAFFDIVLNRGEFVAPAWRKYGPQSWHWSIMKVAIGALVALLFSPGVVAAVHHIIKLAPALAAADPQQKTIPPQMMSFMMMFYGTFFLCYLCMALYMATISVVSAFIVPSMALENSSVGDAFRRFARFVRNESGQFVFYLLVRFGIGIVGYMVVSFAYQIVLMLLIAVFGSICLVIGFALHAAGVPNAILIGLGVFAAIVFMFGVNGYAMCFMLGPFFTFFEAHTLYFLGGRYPMLGDLLERSTPPPQFPTFDPSQQYAPPFA